MRFLYPFAFYFLFLLPLIILFLIRNYVIGVRSLSRLLNHYTRDRFLALYAIKYFFSSVSFIAFYILLIFALADPVVKESGIQQQEKMTNRDTIFLVDVSRSMRADDIAPSRLQRTVETIKVLSSRMSGNRIGLVIFKGTAVTLVPLTEDHSTFYNALDALSPGMLSSYGTNIGSGVDMALRSFPYLDRRERTLILFSDGEELSGSMKESAGRIRQSDVLFFVVGAGTREGALLRNTQGSSIVDRSGKPVISRLKDDSLKQFSDTAGGTYMLLDDPTLTSQIEKGVTTGVGGGLYQSEVRRYRLFLVLALLFLLIWQIIRRLPWWRRGYV